MGESPELSTQTPGELPDVDQDRIAKIAAGTVDDVLEQLDGLSDLELEQLAAVERQGKDRSTLLGAITREIERRAKGEEPEDTGYTPPGVSGDTVNYASMRAADVDRSKLNRPVLSVDGWVLPIPKPEA